MDKHKTMDDSLLEPNNIELGYSCDIALEELMRLLLCNSNFYKELTEVRHALQSYRSQVEFDDGMLPFESSGFQENNLYTQITRHWIKRWQMYSQILPKSLNSDISNTTEKWGLRCQWGCGFMADASLITLLSFDFAPIPKPKPINFFDMGGKYINRAMEQQLVTAKYMGFGKANKKNIRVQIQWLVWRITPPYLSSPDIANRLKEGSGEIIDQFYIQRCYQNMAKLLELKLIRGWTKGRRRNRNGDYRLEPLSNEIKAKYRPSY